MKYARIKVLACCFFSVISGFGMESENAVLQVFNKDTIQPIAKYLTFIERQNLKSSCKTWYNIFKDEPLFLSPFNEQNYYKLMNSPYNYLPLNRLASADVRLRLKVFAARLEDKNKKMFLDLIIKDPGESCPEESCILNHKAIFSNDVDRDELYEKLIVLYGVKWIYKDNGNREHFKELERIISANCRPLLDLLIAQDIDINAIDERGNTILHQLCNKAEYAWAIKRLIQCKSCNVNVVNKHKSTPLHIALIHYYQDSSHIMVDTLLTRDDVKVNIEDEHGYTAMHYTEAKHLAGWMDSQTYLKVCSLGK